MKARISSANPQPLEAIIHVMAWLLILGFPLLLLGRGGDDSPYDHYWMEYLNHLLAPLAIGVVFYTNYGLLVPRVFFAHKQRQRRFYYYNVLLVVVVALMLHFSNDWMHQFEADPDLFPMRMPPPPKWIFFGRDILMLSSAVGLAVAIRMSREWSKAEAARQEAERARTEAELKSLRSQLNPHFLLNTLNNIYALIAIDPDKAGQAVIELSRLLHHMLYENGQAHVPLRQEAEFITNYIDLMRIRLPRDVEVKAHIEVDKESRTQIAPLIFISLIENAFKHGISPTRHSRIDIALTENREEGKVVCRITNTNFPKDSGDKSGSGIGLEQVHRRLELLYPDRYEWKMGLSADGSLYTSELTINV